MTTRTNVRRGVDYERIPVQTHLIHIKEPLAPVFDEYVKPVLAAGRLARGVGEVRDDLAGPRDPPLGRAARAGSPSCS